MSRKVNATGLAAIKQWEGLRLTAYQDSAGVWTIGYGHTANAGSPYPTKGMKITEQQAEETLKKDLAKFEGNVNRLVKVPLNDNQFATLVSFDLNTGALGKSTLLKKLNAGNYDAVPAELMKWVNITDPKTGKKVKLPGLVNRRSAEVGLWVKGEFVSSNTVKAEPTKDTLIKPELVASAGGLISGLAGMASGSGPIQWALAIVMIGSFAAGLAYLWNRNKEEKG